MLIQSRTQRLYASHHQFYVEDQDNPGDTGDPCFWTEETSNDRLAVVEGTVGIGTGTYGNVEVITEIHDKEPPVDVYAWDHITEAGLHVKAGNLSITGCLDKTGENYEVEVGHYCIRCCHANLAKSVEFGEGQDWYLVQIWLSETQPRRVLKRWFA